MMTHETARIVTELKRICEQREREIEADLDSEQASCVNEKVTIDVSALRTLLDVLDTKRDDLEYVIRRIDRLSQEARTHVTSDVLPAGQEPVLAWIADSNSDREGWHSRAAQTVIKDPERYTYWRRLPGRPDRQRLSGAECELETFRRSCEYAYRMGLDPMEFQPVFEALQLCQISTGRARDLFRDWLRGCKIELPTVDDSLRFCVWDQTVDMIRGDLHTAREGVQDFVKRKKDMGMPTKGWKIAAVVEAELMW